MSIVRSSDPNVHPPVANIITPHWNAFNIGHTEMLFNMTESQGKRAFWPTLTVLLAASPDRLKQAALGLPKAKKASRSRPDITFMRPFSPVILQQQINFLETLVKSLGSSTKVAEISMVCLIDLCKAAAYIPSDYDHTPLRALAPELADDLRVSLRTQKGCVQEQI